MRPDIVSPVALQHTNEVTCIPPWYVQDTEYPPAAATYQPLVNGEEAFKAVYEAIASAKKSVEILCWGFQPSMYFIRDGKSGLRIGDLLMVMAQNNVEVRVLGWHMPFNLSGFSGEANLPGEGWLHIKDRVGQVSTEDQYAFDRRWFHTCAVRAGEAAKLRAERRIPVFVGRGFNRHEREEIHHYLKYQSLDPQISKTARASMMMAPTHHQKTVLVDYGLPDCAVGFVMGHNMLDEYWDTDAHSALNRTENTKPAPNAGPRGKNPRQDMSSKISGPILEHLHHNFATAWRKETGEDLLVSRQAKEVGPQLCLAGLPQMAQILRTQAQEGIQDIEQLYLQSVNNATQFIYIENQYFRWPVLAEFIKSVAASQTRAGRDPVLHGSLHLFVVTNASDDAMGLATVNTQRMLASLGRADTIPEVTKLQRIEQIKHDAPPKPEVEPHGGDPFGASKQAQWQADLDQQIKEVNDSKVLPEEVPGLKIHICSLVAPDSPAGQEWMPVYIHSKVMIINDVFTTHGSANINTRSMEVDSELNIAHEWMSVTQPLRRRLWNLHTKGMGAQDDPEEAFNAWQFIINNNKDNQDDKKSGVPCASLIGFLYNKKTIKNMD